MPETTIKLTKADFDADNNYIGKYDLSNATQTIETEINLGCLKFKGSIKTKKSILIAYGCGISAGGGISAGDGISAGWGISAGLTIIAKYISSKLRIFAGLCVWRRPTEEEMKIKDRKSVV